MTDRKKMLNGLRAEADDDEKTLLRLTNEKSALLTINNDLLQQKIDILRANGKQEITLISLYKEQSELLEDNNVLLREKLANIQNDIAVMKTAIQQQKDMHTLATSSKDPQRM